MCRFAAYLGHPVTLDDLLFRPEHSIVDQSMDPDEGPLNGDGFGVGWYVPEMDEAPAVYRNIAPAWADENMKSIAPRVRTPLFFAHVRGASEGMEVQRSNCHPFTSGPLMFMHNGHVGGHDEIVRALRDELSDEIYNSIRGTTDSEHVFALVRDELDDPHEATAGDLARAVRAAIRRVEQLKAEHGVTGEPTRANVALTDGESLVALRYATPADEDPATLFVRRAGRFYRKNGSTGVEDPQGEASVLVSSDPMLDDDTGRTLVPENHLLVVDADGHLATEKVHTPTPRSG